MPVVYRLVSSDIVSLYLDSRAEEQQALYAVGVEYAFMNKYILRAGSFDEHVTAGFGYKHPLFRIDYAIDYSRFAMVSKVGMSFYFSRSKGKVNVAAFSAALGGGGHHNAAGCTVDGSLEDVKSAEASVGPDNAAAAEVRHGAVGAAVEGRCE